MLTHEQEQELIKMKNWLPYRIVFGVIMQDGTFEIHSAYNRRKLNAFVKQGLQVFEVK